MHVIDLPVEQLREAPWNPNQMDRAMLERLRKSISRYGLVENLVVRPLGGDGTYEVLSGNHRLQVLQEMVQRTAPCAVVDLSDHHAQLLAQALNHIGGEDDLGLRAELVRRLLESLRRENVLELLPETVDSLTALASLGQDEIVKHLAAWERAQVARLKHLTIQLTQSQLDVVEEALARQPVPVNSHGTSNLNSRGKALYQLCQDFLKRSEVQR